MTKRVLHIFGIMNRGGAELRTISLINEMHAKDVYFEFCVLSGQKGVLDERIIQMGGKVHYCQLSLTFVWRFLTLLKQHKFDVVHSHVSLVSGVILLLSRLASIPTRIAHFRSTADVKQRTLARKCRDVILRFLVLANANHILGVSKGALNAYWPGRWQSDARFKVLYNGFKRQGVPNKEPFWEQYIPAYDGANVLVNVGRMDTPKNHSRQASIFAEYIKLYPKAWLIFIGKENPQVKQQIFNLTKHTEAACRIVFLGEQAEVIAFLQHSQLMLFPSLWEGLPGAVIEAASVGTPVLASSIPGVVEISAELPNVYPLSLQCSDTVWAEKINQMLSQSVDRQRAIKMFDNSSFQLTACVEQLYAIYTA